MSETRTLTLKVTEIPASKPGQHLADLIEWTHGVDALLDPIAVERAARAWVIASTMAEQTGGEIRLATLLALFASCASPPADPGDAGSMTDGEADALNRIMGGGQ